MRRRWRPTSRSSGASIGRDEAVARGSARPDLQGARSSASSPEGEVISFYRHGAFIDLCRGPHLESTGKIGAFKLLNSAAAYWRGDEKRPMLQRIYGSVWETQEELDQYLWRVEEAKKRDHRKLGRELDLFSFHPESPAAPFWHPRGMALWRALEDWSRQVRSRGRLRRGADARTRPQGAVGDAPATGRSTRTTCSSSTTPTT